MLKHQEGSYLSRMTAIDSIMCPGYAYSAFKAPGKLTPAFAAKAEKFFSEQSGKMNDGVLVIVGDIAEDVLKKALLEYVGAFSTSSTAYRRPVVKYQPVSGWSTYTVDGYDNSVDIAMSARMPLTAGNYAAAAVAAKMLEQRIVEHMSEAGMYVSVSQNCRIYPEERVNLNVSVMNVTSSIDALSMLRSVLSCMSSAALDEGHLAACKAALKNEVSLEMKSPLYWTNAIALRYLDGKDLTTGYAGHIDAVKAADVRNVLEMLENGSKVEYVITKK
jgi:predicted Zn-dependent peptidase